MKFRKTERGRQVPERPRLSAGTVPYTIGQFAQPAFVVTDYGRTDGSSPDFTNGHDDDPG